MMPPRSAITAQYRVFRMMRVGFARVPQHPEHRHETRDGNRTGDPDDDDVSPVRADQMMMHSDLRLGNTHFNDFDFILLLPSPPLPAWRLPACRGCPTNCARNQRYWRSPSHCAWRPTGAWRWRHT